MEEPYAFHKSKGRNIYSSKVSFDFHHRWFLYNFLSLILLSSLRSSSKLVCVFDKYQDCSTIAVNNLFCKRVDNIISTDRTEWRKKIHWIARTITWLWLGSIPILLAGLGLAVEGLLDHIEDAAHADGTEEVLEGEEGVGDAEEEGGELEVDEEDDHPEVDERVGRGDQVGLLVNDKHKSSQQTRLCRAENVSWLLKHKAKASYRNIYFCPWLWSIVPTVQWLDIFICRDLGTGSDIFIDI